VIALLPNKYVRVRGSLIGVGARLLAHLDKPRSVSDLWTRMKDQDDALPYDQFVFALDLIYALAAVDLHQGLVVRARTE
jgi:hypothetical protein